MVIHTMGWKRILRTEDGEKSSMVRVVRTKIEDSDVKIGKDKVKEVIEEMKKDISKQRWALLEKEEEVKAL